MYIEKEKKKKRNEREEGKSNDTKEKSRRRRRRKTEREKLAARSSFNVTRSEWLNKSNIMLMHGLIAQQSGKENVV